MKPHSQDLCSRLVLFLVESGLYSRFHAKILSNQLTSKSQTGMLHWGQTNDASFTLLRHITQLDGLNSEGPHAK